jgi:hypothetical protein
VNIETIPYYVRILILPMPSRTEGGRRVYGPDQVLHSAHPRNGLPPEIRILLKLAKGIHPCGEVKAAAEALMNMFALRL